MERCRYEYAAADPRCIFEVQTHSFNWQTLPVQVSPGDVFLRKHTQVLEYAKNQ